MQTTFKTLILAINFHRECQKLKMKSYLKNQLERATASVALNLGEGNARISSKDRQRFFNIAYASLKEAQIALALAAVTSPQLLDHADHLGASIYKLHLRAT